jgi:cell division protease FtsH
MPPEKNSFTSPGKKGPSPSEGGQKEGFPGPFFIWVLVFIALFYLLRLGSGGIEPGVQALTYGEFYAALRAEGQGTPSRVRTAQRAGNEIRGVLADGQSYRVYVPPEDPDLETLLKTRVERYEIKPEKTFWIQFFYTILGPILFVGLFWFLIYRGGGGAGRIMSFGKSRAKPATGSQKVSFKDVAGIDEAKEELQEVIEFLKDPKRFQRLGGRIPKGVLLIGPPGTGKTLLAKAISGEANVPFFSISGSDFVEMFVGVGASRVRDLFDQAKKAAKQSGRGAIIFIDEIDAVGRQRFAGIGGGHDEREQTLNALLVEMDGFGTHEAVILLAATNRPDVLDPALLRPGRFDRQVVIDKPDLNGREAILKVHTAKLKMDPAVDLKSIARQTPGFSGADLANLGNEAALMAARAGKEFVGMVELQEAIERVMAGPERKSRRISDREKRIVAFHESGHALMSLLTPGTDPLHKVSIISRGVAALGYTLQVPEEDRYLASKSELLARLLVLMGGRASEEIVFGEITTGAHNDIEVATRLARRMVCEFGMSDKLGNITLAKENGMVFLGRDLMDEKHYSEETARVIDAEVKRLLDEAYQQAKERLAANRGKLDTLAKALMEREVLDVAEVRKLLSLEEESSRAARPTDS